MSDLRTRIARALTLHQRRNSQHCICGWGQLGHSHADHQADAVIRELGLPPTWGKPSFDNGRLEP
jgi:hypothetical protein